MVFLHRPLKELNWMYTWYGYMLRNIHGSKNYPTQSLIVVIYDTPKVAIFGALTRYIYIDISVYSQVGVALLLRLIFESNQDSPCDFVMSCWQSLCSRLWIDLSMVVFQWQYLFFLFQRISWEPRWETWCCIWRDRGKLETYWCNSYWR